MDSTIAGKTTLILKGSQSKALLAGKANTIPAQRGEHYKVFKKNADGEEQMQDDVIAKRRGDDLQLSYADGTQLTLENYYVLCKAGDCNLTLPSSDLAGFKVSADGATGAALSDGSTLSYAHGNPSTLMAMAQGDAGLGSTLAALQGSEVTYAPATVNAASAAASSGSGLWAALGGLGLAAAAAAAAAGGSGSGSSSSSSTTTNNVVKGQIAAGPTVSGNGLQVEVFQADGKTLLGTTTVKADGTFSLGVGSYTGVVIVKVTDTNSSPDYIDEASGQAKNLDTVLMAVAIAGNGTVTANINPVTTIAAIKAGLSSDGTLNSNSPIGATQVSNANAVVASALGLDNILTTTPVTTVTSSGTANSSFNIADGTSAAEKYGAVLASLSGVAKTNGTAKSIELVANGIDATGNLGTVNTSTQSLLVAGASTAAENENSAGRDVLTTTVAKAAAGASTTPSTVESDLANALLAIKDAAGENNAADSVSVSTFAQAGVTGVTNDNLAAINSALDSASVTSTQVNSTSKIQDLVNAYSSILSGADGNAANNNANASAAQYSLVGVTGVSVASASLLNDVVDGKAASDVSTVAKLQTLADAANAVIAGAGGGTAPTLEQLTLLGIKDVNTSNLAAVQAAIAGTADNGSNVDTLAELQTLVSAVAPATLTITLANDGGSSRTDHITKDGTVNVNGIEVGATWQYSTDGGKTWAAGDGTSVTLSGDGPKSVTVRQTDAGGVTSAVSDSLTFTLDTSAPTVTSGATATSIDENSGAGQVVYTAKATDSSNANADVTFGIGGTDAALFSIDPASGEVTLKSDPNYETKTSYSFTITATDAASNVSTSQSVTLDVNNIKDAVIGTPTVAAVTEDSSVSDANLTATGTISISDADSGQASFSTTVTSADGNLGSLVLASDGSYTYTVANSDVQYLGAGSTKVDTFTVKSTDGTTKEVSFTVNGTEDAPVLKIQDSTRTVDENSNPFGRIIAFNGSSNDLNVADGTATTTQHLRLSDVDSTNLGGDTIKVSVTSGNMNQLRLGVSSSSGVFSLDSDGYVHYYSDATYNGDTGINVVPHDPNNTAADIKIGRIYDGEHTGRHGEALWIRLNENATTAITQALASKIYLGVTNTGDNSVTQDWSAAAGTKTVKFEIADGRGSVLTSDDRTVNVISHADVLSQTSIAKTYGLGKTITVTVTTDEAVYVDTTNGTPYYVLDIGGVTKNATYVGGSGTTQLTYTYVVESGLNDADGIDLVSQVTNGAVITDGSGSTLISGTYPISVHLGDVRVDTVAPAKASITAITDNSGYPNDRLTNDSTPTITFTTEPGALIFLVNRDGTSIELSKYSVQETSPGSYQIIVSQALADGGYAVVVADAAGNINGNIARDGTDAATFFIDTVAPAAPTINTVAGDNTINASEFDGVNTLSGTCESGASVSLSVAGYTRSATVSDTTWSYTLTDSELSALQAAQADLQGSFTVSVTQTDAAGNPSDAKTVTLTLDTIAPEVARLTLGAGVEDGATFAEAAQDSGVITVSAEKGSTITLVFRNDTHPTSTPSTLSSTLAASAPVVFRSFEATGDTQAITLSAEDIKHLDDGTITVSSTVTDAAGNVTYSTTAGGRISFGLDTQAPEVPKLTLNNDTGSTDPTPITSDASLTVSDAASGVTRSYSIDGGEPTGVYYAPTEDGEHTVTVIDTDAAGNSSSASVTFTLDTTAPGDVYLQPQGSALDDGALNASEKFNTLRVILAEDGNPIVPLNGLISLKLGDKFFVQDFQITQASIDKGFVDLEVGDLGDDGAKTLSLLITDEAGNTHTQSLSFWKDTVKPEFTSGGTASIDENNGADLVVYVADTDEPDGAVVFSLQESDDWEKFSIVDSSTGEVYLLDNPDAETQPSYTFTVIATDAAGNRSSQTVTLEVNDLDEVAPTITSLDTATVTENVAAGTLVYTAHVTDTGDVSNGVTLSMDGANASSFTFNARTGEVRLKDSPDYETRQAYTFTITARDAAGNASSKTVTLNVKNVDDTAPDAPVLSYVGSKLDDGYLNASEASGGFTVRAGLLKSYSPPVKGDTVEIQLNGASFETRKIITLSDADIKAGYVEFAVSPSELGTDGRKSLTAVITDVAGNHNTSGAKVFTLDVNAPEFTSASATASINENVAVDTVVYQPSLTDASYKGAKLSYTLGGADAHFFKIDPNSGAVTINSTPDYETKTGYTFTVTARDAAGNPSATQTVTLGVNDLNDNAPVFKSDPTASVNENADTSTVVYQASTTDADATSANRAVVYSLTGTDAKLLSISSSGEVTLNDKADFEKQSSYSFTVVASNSGSSTTLVTTQDVTLSVNDLNDNAPVFHTGAVIGSESGVSVFNSYVQTDGKVVVSGTVKNAGSEWRKFSISMLNEDGGVDTSFDTDGTVSHAVGQQSYFGATTSHSNADGTILVAGSARTAASSGEFAVVRLLVNGTIDTRFSEDGSLTYALGTRDNAFAIENTSQGIIVAGISDDKLSVIRLLEDGSFDKGFGSDGVFLGQASKFAFASMAVQSDGGIVLVGTDYSKSSVVHLSPKGSLDTNFNSGDAFFQTEFSVKSVTLDGEGKILLAGTNSDEEFTVTRLNADGQQDSTFGTNGVFSAHIGEQHIDQCSSVIVQTDGKILLAGSSFVDTGMFRYASLIRLNDDGSLDTTFGDGGKAVLPMNNSSGGDYNVSVQDNGKIIVTGNTGEEHLGVMRLNADGSVDTTFGDATQATVEDTVYVSQNITTNDVVYQAHATDADTLSNLHYSLSGADADYFNFNAVTGEVKFKDVQDPANGDTPWYLEIIASDGMHASNTLDVTILVKDHMEVTASVSRANHAIM